MSLPWSIFCINYCLLTDQAVLNFSSPDIGGFSWIWERQLYKFSMFYENTVHLKKVQLEVAYHYHACLPERWHYVKLILPR
jgi:hypothetical protein